MQIKFNQKKINTLVFFFFLQFIFLYIPPLQSSIGKNKQRLQRFYAPIYVKRHLLRLVMRYPIAMLPMRLNFSKQELHLSQPTKNFQSMYLEV